MKEQDIAKIHALKIHHVGLPSRASNALRRAGIKTIGDVVKMTYEDLMEVPSFGERAMRELNKVLFGYGLRLNHEFRHIEDPVYVKKDYWY